MTKKIIITVCLIALCTSISNGQIYLNSEEIEEFSNPDSTTFQFTSIEIIGNNKTKPDIILRELHFKDKERISLDKISAALKRVQSLALFTRVRFDIIGDSEYSILLITVYERWYIFPVPLLYRNERTWKKISYGGKLLHYNFMGRNILLNFSAAFGYNPQVKLSYFNPWFLGDAKLFTNFSLFHSRIRSLSPALNEYEDRRWGIEWLIGKRFGHFFYTGVTIGYMKLTAPPEIGLTLSPGGKDYLPSIMLSIQYDDRDLREYPHKGWLIGLFGKRVGNSDDINYYRYGIDWRSYLPLNHKVTLALRTAMNLSSGKIPSYDRVYLGYEERIRGRYYEIFEGENFAFGGAELRFPLMKIRYIEVDPIMSEMSQYSSNLKFGISGGIFFDNGVVWYQNQALSIHKVKSGFGAGIHFHLPYIDVFRLECGFNKQWKAQAIADIEVAF
jgi:outer membrane protein assembly factor BamA